MEWTYPRLLELPSVTDELIAEFVGNREQTVAAVAAHPDAGFERRVRSAGGTVGTLADVLWFVAVEHVRGHLADLRRSSS